jgi:microcompartment protein CcmL/EutN
MQILELPLFTSQESINKNTSPAKQVTPNQTQRPLPNPHDSIETVLQSMFPQQTEENKIIRTKRILGKTANSLSDEQIECINSEFKFLADAWLDEYEKEVFGGKTLKEVINEH